MPKTQWHLDDEEVEAIIEGLEFLLEAHRDGAPTTLSPDQLRDLLERIDASSDIILEVP